MSAKDIERLAKVLREVKTPLRSPFVEAAVQEHAVAQVRAVIAAMREPTESQYDALCRTDKMWREQTSETVWTTYIDALLEDADV